MTAIAILAHLFEENGRKEKALFIRKTAEWKTSRFDSTTTNLTTSSLGDSSMTMPTITESTTTSSSLSSKTSLAIVVPNFFLAGAQKAGTTSVAQWLFEHPSKYVCKPKIFEGEDLPYYDKEIHFFDRPDRYGHGLDFYVKRFQHCQSSPIVMDGTPESVAQSTRIKQFYMQNQALLLNEKTDLKVMMILREPISRELSWYNHMKRQFIKFPNYNASWSDVAPPSPPHTTNINWTLARSSIYSFDEYVHNFLYPKKLMDEQAVKKSYYAKYLNEWMEWIPRESILVLSHDEIITNPKQFLRRISQFLNLSDDGLNSIARSNEMSFKHKTKLPSCHIQQNLTHYFESKNQELYDFLEQYPGPTMEQRPFPKFQLGECKP